MDNLDELIERLRWMSFDTDSPYEHEVCDRAADALTALKAERDALVDTLTAVHAFAKRMRHANRLVGPFPNDPKANSAWVRTLYHEGKDLVKILKPSLAAPQQKDRDDG